MSALAYGLLPPVPECAALGAYPAAALRDNLYAWYSAVAGLSETELGRRFAADGGPGEPSPLSVVRALRRQPQSVQVAWAGDAAGAVISCRTVDLGVPAN